MLAWCPQWNSETEKGHKMKLKTIYLDFRLHVIITYMCLFLECDKCTGFWVA